MRRIQLAICQMNVGPDKENNLIRAGALVEEAAGCGANLVMLPEVFNAPYQTCQFPAYAEEIPGPTSLYLASLARSNNTAIVGGTIIEREGARLYNTCLVYDNQGSLLAKHRKVHLFDIDIPGKISFRESRTLSPGDRLACFTLGAWRFAVAVCYDIRFPEMSRIAALEGAHGLLVPAAFNLTTGPLHWELLMRARAVDNQMYVAAASPARNETASYQVWGHSMVVDPWGQVVISAGTRQEIIYADLAMDKVEEVREEIPVLRQRRTDLYTINHCMMANLNKDWRIL